MAKREVEGVGGRILHSLMSSIAMALILDGCSCIEKVYCSSAEAVV